MYIFFLCRSFWKFNYIKLKFFNVVRETEQFPYKVFCFSFYLFHMQTMRIRMNNHRWIPWWLMINRELCWFLKWNCLSSRYVLLLYPCQRLFRLRSRTKLIRGSFKLVTVRSKVWSDPSNRAKWIIWNRSTCILVFHTLCRLLEATDFHQPEHPCLGKESGWLPFFY